MLSLGREEFGNQSCALQPTDFKQIFRPPLDHYDVIIHLHSGLLPGATLSLDRRKHLTEQPSLSRPSGLLSAVNFDIAQLYLEELKVLQAQYKMPLPSPQTSDKSKQVQSWVIPNISAILSDFQTIGEELVKKIEVLNA